ncbi:MAG: hypothetical protein U0237_00075 [Thermoleophilia bacterium]
MYSRSSGAAWSMAARRYFRKGEAELPKGGAWTYRGTQVVTGAEARKVAAEQAAERRRAAEELLRAARRNADHGPMPRTAFSHEAPPAPRPPRPTNAQSGPSAAASGTTRPATSRSAASGAPVSPSARPAPAPTAASGPDRPSFITRMRRALGLR